MFTTYVVVTLMAIAANTFAATADFLRFKFVLIHRSEGRCAGIVAAHAWHPQSSRRARITGRPHRRATVGTAAAVGLVLFFVVAIIAHLRVRDYSIGPAAAFLLLAVAAQVFGTGLVNCPGSIKASVHEKDGVTGRRSRL